MKRSGEIHYLSAIVYVELTLYPVALIFAAPSRLWLCSSTTANGKGIRFEFGSSWLIVVVLDIRLDPECR
jgi:hypothetical protein